MIASHDFMYTLAWSLLHFVWQGAAIAALAAAVMFVFRGPGARYLIGIGALALMLVSFGVTFALIDGSSVHTTGFSTEGAPAAVPASPLETPASSVWMPESQAANNSGSDTFLWVARGWLAGVFLLALRIAFGLLVIEYLRRRNLVALPPALVEKFRALQERLGIRRAIRYCECRLVGVPSVIGFFRPVVLVPVRALTGLTPEQLEAVIAHELGHIKRFDVVVNFFQVIAETLFFFHPAVWWLNKRIRADREDCCDDVAVAACGGTVGYARALVAIEGWRDAPHFAMAATGSPMAARITRLLGMGRSETGARAVGVFTASLVLMTALLAGIVSIALSRPAVAQSAEPVAQAAASASAPAVSEVESAAPTASAAPAPAPAARPAPAAKPVPNVRPARPARVPSPPSPPNPANPPSPPAPASPANEANPAASDLSSSYIDELKSVGLEDLDIDMMIALRTQDVTVEYVHEMQAAGFDADGDELLAMKVHGVTPQYIRDIRALGLNPGADEIAAMKAQGVDVAFIKAMRELGLDGDTGEMIAMKVHGVTPQYVRDVRALGFKPDADAIASMKAQGVDAQYVKGMRDLGLDGDIDDIVAMKVQGITPDYVRTMRAAGFNTDTDGFVSLKVQDVTPEYARALEKAGYKLSTDELIHAKVMDITPQFIEKARAHGFKDLNIDKLIGLKNADVL